MRPVQPEETARVESYLHEQIPLTRVMELRVLPNEQLFTVTAPVSANRNHLQTAFGGSINAVATLAAYGLLWWKLRAERDCHVVVMESSIRFLRPVREMIRARCLEPAAEAWRQFQESVEAKGSGKLTLEVRVEEDGLTSAEFTGLFLARKEKR